MERVIVDTLELPEIVEIVKGERSRIIGKISPLSGKYNRTIIQRRPKDRLDLPPIVWSGKSGIRYHFLPFIRNYSDYKKGGLSFSLFGDFYYRNGLFSVFAVNNLSDWLLFSPHFFERYRERYLKSERDTASETMERFFRINDISKVEETEKGIFATTIEGVSLGEKTGSLKFFKTFISSDLLKGEQIYARESGLSDIARQYLKNSNV